LFPRILPIITRTRATERIRGIQFTISRWIVLKGSPERKIDAGVVGVSPFHVASPRPHAVSEKSSHLRAYPAVEKLINSVSCLPTTPACPPARSPADESKERRSWERLTMLVKYAIAARFPLTRRASISARAIISRKISPTDCFSSCYNTPADDAAQRTNPSASPSTCLARERGIKRQVSSARFVSPRRGDYITRKRQRAADSHSRDRSNRPEISPASREEAAMK